MAQKRGRKPHFHTLNSMAEEVSEAIGRTVQPMQITIRVLRAGITPDCTIGKGLDGYSRETVQQIVSDFKANPPKRRRREKAGAA